jgi:hypothetical protein
VCHYCGCRDFPLIGRLSADHVAIAEQAGLLRRAVVAGRNDAGVLTAVDRRAPHWPPVLDALDRLRRHIGKEEHGLFPAVVVTLLIEEWDAVTAPQSPHAGAEHRR